MSEFMHPNNSEVVIARMTGYQTYCDSKYIRAPQFTAHVVGSGRVWVSVRVTDDDDCVCVASRPESRDGQTVDANIVGFGKVVSGSSRVISFTVRNEIPLIKDFYISENWVARQDDLLTHPTGIEHIVHLLDIL